MNDNNQTDDDSGIGTVQHEIYAGPEPVKQLEGEERRQTLHNMLLLRNAIDNGTIEKFTDEEVEELMFRTEGKIDACKFILDRYKQNALFWKHEEWIASKNRKAAETGWENLRAAMARALKENEFEKFPGVKWIVRQTKSEAVEVNGTLNDALVMKYPELFKTSIVARLTPIKEYIKTKGNLEFAYIKQNISVAFSANPDAKLDKNLKKKDIK